MRIAVFHELPYGGARRAVNELARELKKNHTVDLYIVDEKEDRSEKHFYSQTNFYRFLPRIWKGKNWKVRLYKDTIELIKLYFLHRQIAEKIHSRRYDILFVHSSKYTEAPFILRFPNTFKVFYCHDPHYRMLYEDVLAIPQNLDVFRYNYERINRVLRKKIDKTNLQNADLVLANSLYTKKGVKRAYGIDSTVCYLGVDTQVFRPTRTKKTLDLFYIGSREAVDGYSLLQEILQRIKKKIVTKIITVEDEWISDDTVLRDYYNRSKIVLCLAVNEPLGLVPLEAMSCGTPVIATDEAGHKETVKHGKTGLLLRRNAEDIAKKITFLLSHPDRLRKMGETARKEIVANWTWKEAGKRIELIFKTINT